MCAYACAYLYARTCTLAWFKLPCMLSDSCSKYCTDFTALMKSNGLKLYYTQGMNERNLSLAPQKGEKAEKFFYFLSQIWLLKECTSRFIFSITSNRLLCLFPQSPSCCWFYLLWSLFITFQISLSIGFHFSRLLILGKSVYKDLDYVVNDKVRNLYFYFV